MDALTGQATSRFSRDGLNAATARLAAVLDFYLGTLSSIPARDHSAKPPGMRNASRSPPLAAAGFLPDSVWTFSRNLRTAALTATRAKYNHHHRAKSFARTPRSRGTRHSVRQACGLAPGGRPPSSPSFHRWFKHSGALPHLAPGTLPAALLGIKRLPSLTPTVGHNLPPSPCRLPAEKAWRATYLKTACTDTAAKGRTSPSKRLPHPSLHTYLELHLLTELSYLCLRRHRLRRHAAAWPKGREIGSASASGHCPPARPRTRTCSYRPPTATPCLLPHHCLLGLPHFLPACLQATTCLHPTPHHHYLSLLTRTINRHLSRCLPASCLLRMPTSRRRTSGALTLCFCRDYLLPPVQPLAPLCGQRGKRQRRKTDGVALAQPPRNHLLRRSRHRWRDRPVTANEHGAVIWRKRPGSPRRDWRRSSCPHLDSNKNRRPRSIMFSGIDGAQRRRSRKTCSSKTTRRHYGAHRCNIL